MTAAWLQEAMETARDARRLGRPKTPGSIIRQGPDSYVPMPAVVARHCRIGMAEGVTPVTSDLAGRPNFRRQMGAIPLSSPTYLPPEHVKSHLIPIDERQSGTDSSGFHSPTTKTLNSSIDGSSNTHPVHRSDRHLLKYQKFPLERVRNPYSSDRFKPP